MTILYQCIPLTGLRDVWREAAEALRKITGQDFGEDIARWREWWEQEQRRPQGE